MLLFFIDKEYGQGPFYDSEAPPLSELPSSHQVPQNL